MLLLQWNQWSGIESESIASAGGQLVIATWCQREETPTTPLTQKDRADLQFLYDEWTHPHFISKEAYSRLMEVSLSTRPQHWNHFSKLQCFYVY